MFGPESSEVVWLTITNAILGIVTLGCLLVVGTVAFRELAARARAKVRIPATEDDHAFDLGGLGITMADGGERIDGKSKKTDPSSKKQ